MYRITLLLSVFTLFACSQRDEASTTFDASAATPADSGAAVDAGPHRSIDAGGLLGLDAGSEVDAGLVEVDAGAEEDSGAGTDAGTDAGTGAGTGADAGPVPERDAGTPPRIDGGTWSGTSCRVDADCRLYASYCIDDPCGCTPLGSDERAPACTGTVTCFVDPCRSQRASCISGICGSILTSS